MCVCVFICVYVCVCVCIYVCVYICMCIYICLYMCLGIYMCVYICTYSYVYVYIYIWVYYARYYPINSLSLDQNHVPESWLSWKIVCVLFGDIMQHSNPHLKLYISITWVLTLTTSRSWRSVSGTRRTGRVWLLERTLRDPTWSRNQAAAVCVYARGRVSVCVNRYAVEQCHLLIRERPRERIPMWCLLAVSSPWETLRSGSSTRCRPACCEHYTPSLFLMPTHTVSGPMMEAAARSTPQESDCSMEEIIH